MARKSKPAAPAVPKLRPRDAGPKDVALGQRIRLRRAEMNISQTELGQKIGVSFQQVQKYEKGVNRIGATRLEQIGAALGVPSGFFFADLGKQQTEIESLMFHDSAYSVRLLRAYSAIKPAKIRQQFVRLMEQVAGLEADEG